MYLGAHLGIAQGLDTAVLEARKIGCEALQIFSKSPQMWAGPPIPGEAAERFRSAVRAEGLRATAVHHGYLLNLASPKRVMLARSRRAFRDEIERAELLGVDALVFHPGARLDSAPEDALRTLAESLKAAVEAFPDGHARLVLENSAGQGSTLCSTFEELATTLNAVNAPDRLGVLLDTCHLFAAGFDFRSDEGYGNLLDRIAATFGRAKVVGFHLNDAKAPVGSHLDRHENIGDGEIGLAGFAHFVNDPGWAGVPGYLETPLDDRGYARYAEDLATLRGLARTEEKSPGKSRAPRPASRRASTVK
jgi:deoxyribonuclease IV